MMFIFESIQPKSSNSTTKEPSSSVTTSHPDSTSGTEDRLNNSALTSPNNSEEKPGKKSKKKQQKNKSQQQQVKEVQPNVFEFCSSLYRFGEHLAEYNRLYQELYPQLMGHNSKFYICTEQKGVGSLDLLFETFCKYMGMEKLKNLPNGSGERVFCWLGKRKASEILPTLRPNHHAVNRLPLDVFLKDKQSLALTLQSSIFQRSIGYPEHNCEHHSGRRIRHQLLCPHQYAEHNFRRCSVSGCFETLQQEARKERQIAELHNGEFCPCFRSNFFVPETRVFASSVQQNVFIEEITRLALDSQWIVKPSYMRRGRGVRVLPSVEQLRSFLKVETRQRFMWGQDYLVQRYIENPMLTSAGQKFDVRMFLLVIVCRFWRVLGFLHPGYVRKVSKPYREMRPGDRFDPREHLANTRIWRRAAADATAAAAASAAASAASSSSASSATEKKKSASVKQLPESLNSVCEEDFTELRSPETSVVEVAESEAVNKIQQNQPQIHSQSTEQVPPSLQSLESSLLQTVSSLTCPRLLAAQQGRPNHQQLLVQRQNHAKSGGKPRTKGRQKAAAEPEIFEPVPLTEFFQQSFEADECEEFNYAVRHGCLKQNSVNLPLLLGAIKIPGASHLKTKMAQKPKSFSVGANQVKSNNSATKVTRGKSSDGQKGKQKTASVRNPPTEQELLEPFTMNKEFIQRLRLMATRICEGIFDQIKEKANCYQLFSLDICIDAFGNPWLLEVNPTIVTEDVNWNSSTIREVIPAVLNESLGLAHECTRKSSNFLALRTPSSHRRKPSDLVFRQNFLWMYSTPRKSCELSELKSLKYGVDSMHRQQLASRGIDYQPVDYYPKLNNRRISKKESRQLADQNNQSADPLATAAAANRCSYRFPSPVSSVPVLEEDLAYSTRFLRLEPDIVGRQLLVRRMQAESRVKQRENMRKRFAAHRESRRRQSVTVRHRICVD